MPHPRKSDQAKKNPIYHGDDLRKRSSAQERQRTNKGESWERKGAGSNKGSRRK